MSGELITDPTNQSGPSGSSDSKANEAIAAANTIAKNQGVMEQNFKGLVEHVNTYINNQTLRVDTVDALMFSIIHMEVNEQEEFKLDDASVTKTRAVIKARLDETYRYREGLIEKEKKSGKAKKASN